LVRANYRNVQNGINAEPLFLVRFFRNLLMGESNTLKNRYMMIDGPEEWKLPESEQTPREDRTSTGQVQDKLHTDNPDIAKLVRVIGEQSFLDTGIQAAVEETLRRKAEVRHYTYSPIPLTSQRYRFVALNEMARRLTQK